MQRSYSIADARSKLAEIIAEVEGGEDIEIVRPGKKVTVLVSPARYARMAGKKTAFGDLRVARRSFPMGSMVCHDIVLRRSSRRP